MGLKTSKVYKCLEKKTLILGFEIFDLFLLCILLSVLNLVCGNSQWKLFYTWVPTLILAVALRYGKKDKPDNFMVHWLKFQFSPGVYSAFQLVKDIRKKKVKLSTARRLNLYE